MKKYTQRNGEKPKPFSNRTSVPFSVRFQPKLARGFTFSELNVHQLKEWQNFLDNISQMSFEEVDKRYRRKSDKTDIYNGEQVIHYGFGERFRVHGVIENAQFVVLRMDPAHSFHS